ncbi:EPT/RTPC-like protein [Parathielavia appendiculata]|uniref:EPT/RTPC-like protein n=1 Tax=Parathielavia appendiculata TaxID=2587402 RepID=A0AAN6Z4F4_9PEZI|nr:EPT/RTPC-like protein [Parathielavia appendiculata]
MKDKTHLIELDGRTGEGGGQLVRIACALAAVATQPIRITNVRGNREGPRGGGLKSQHVTAIEYLATATDADVSGLFIGSHTLEFHPKLRPSDLNNRNIKITADSPAASTLLIFQAVFPFLLFAGNDKGEPITLEISGGTNVSYSLSFEYLDQVLLPTLQDAFGITVERKLLSRGWSLGKQQRGKVEFRFKPLKPGETLKLKEKDSIVYNGDGPMPVMEDIEEINISMIVPTEMHEAMTEALVADLGALFPDIEPNFNTIEDSGADSRIYVLLVAKAGMVRWGRDVLSSMPKKAKGKGAAQTASSLCATISRKIAKELYEEVSTGGVVDEFLQDQLVIFQVLAEGRTSFPRGEAKDSLEQTMANLEIDDKRLRKEKTDKPFGDGSTHTTTARWVTAELLPNVAWYNKGLICEGIGMQLGKKR